jgi:hypothetical protein
MNYQCEQDDEARRPKSERNPNPEIRRLALQTPPMLARFSQHFEPGLSADGGSLAREVPHVGLQFMVPMRFLS